MMQYQNIFDSHAHYNDSRFLEDQQAIIDQIHQSGVSYVLNAGCDLPSSESGIQLSERYPFFYCSVGIHPDGADSLSENYLQQLEALSKHPKAVAIGEIGLDYYYEDPGREIQKKVFEEQLALAKELNLPVIIHARDAWEDTMALLKKYRPRGVVHCFSGSAEIAKEIVKLGMYIGFTGVLTFKNARRALEAVEVIPEDRLLLETDCPYMAPVPFRGKRCDSSMIPYTAQKMAELKKLPVQEMIDRTTENARRLFSID